jgi:hypothetical protein
MRMANDGNNEWAMACIVDGGGGVDILGGFNRVPSPHRIKLSARLSVHLPVRLPVHLSICLSV